MYQFPFFKGVLSGDTERAKTLVKVGEKQLNILTSSMTAQGLTQGERQVRVDDDTLISVSSIFNTRTIKIWCRPIKGEKKKEEKEKKCFCSCCFAEAVIVCVTGTEYDEHGNVTKLPVYDYGDPRVKFDIDVCYRKSNMRYEFYRINGVFPSDYTRYQKKDSVIIFFDGDKKKDACSDCNNCHGVSDDDSACSEINVKLEEQYKFFPIILPISINKKIPGDGRLTYLSEDILYYTCIKDAVVSSITVGPLGTDNSEWEDAGNVHFLWSESNVDQKTKDIIYCGQRKIDDQVKNENIFAFRKNDKVLVLVFPDNYNKRFVIIGHASSFLKTNTFGVDKNLRFLLPVFLIFVFQVKGDYYPVDMIINSWADCICKSFFDPGFIDSFPVDDYAIEYNFKRAYGCSIERSSPIENFSPINSSTQDHYTLDHQAHLQGNGTVSYDIPDVSGAGACSVISESKLCDSVDFNSANADDPVHAMVVNDFSASAGNCRATYGDNGYSPNNGNLLPVGLAYKSFCNNIVNYRYETSKVFIPEDSVDPTKNGLSFFQVYVEDHLTKWKKAHVALPWGTFWDGGQWESAKEETVKTFKLSSNVNSPSIVFEERNLTVSINSPYKVNYEDLPAYGPYSQKLDSVMLEQPTMYMQAIPLYNVFMCISFLVGNKQTQLFESTGQYGSEDYVVISNENNLDPTPIFAFQGYHAIRENVNLDLGEKDHFINGSFLGNIISTAVPSALISDSPPAIFNWIQDNLDSFVR